MVPMKAIKDTKLDDGYVIPKGAVVLPSIWSATKEGYPLADEFEPERFGKERDEGAKYAKHFLVFGHGPHKCLGKPPVCCTFGGAEMWSFACPSDVL